MRVLVHTSVMITLLGASYLRADDQEPLARSREYLKLAVKCLEDSRKESKEGVAELGSYLAESFCRLGNFQQAKQVIDGLPLRELRGPADVCRALARPLGELIRAKKDEELTQAKAHYFAKLKRDRYWDDSDTFLRNLVLEAEASALAELGDFESAAKRYREINVPIPESLLQCLDPSWLPLAKKEAAVIGGNYCRSLAEAEMCLNRLPTIELLSQRFERGLGQMILARFALGAARLGCLELARDAASRMSDIPFRIRIRNRINYIQELQNLEGDLRAIVVSDPELEAVGQMWRRDKRQELIELLESAMKHDLEKEVKRWLPKLSNAILEDKPKELRGNHNLDRVIWFDRLMRVARMQAATGEFEAATQTAGDVYRPFAVKADLIGRTRRGVIAREQLEEIIRKEPSAVARGWLWMAMARKELEMPPIDAWPAYNDLEMEVILVFNS
jgi:hypothetical protein